MSKHPKTIEVKPVKLVSLFETALNYMRDGGLRSITFKDDGTELVVELESSVTGNQFGWSNDIKAMRNHCGSAHSFWYHTKPPQK